MTVAQTAAAADVPPDSRAAVSAADLARLVKDLHRPDGRIFWLDFLGSVLVAAGGLALAFLAAMRLGDGLLAAAGLVVATLALYRAALFTHEIAHLPPGGLPGFEIAWNLLCGIPLLIPSFLYRSHRKHHATATFGTGSDSEYLGPGLRGWRGIAGVLVLSLLLPPSLILRFAVLTPLSWVSPAVRDWTDRRASALALIGLDRSDPPGPAGRRARRWQEGACVAYLAAVAGLLATGLLPVAAVALVAVPVFGALILNALRLLGAHRYIGDGHPVSRQDQILDSYNYPRRRWATVLWAPLGLHLHALHHMFPGLPYHALPAAHRRLVAALPPDHSYHRVEATGLLSSLAAFARG